jgi:cilia- and flagella-associated protein 251
MPVCTAEIDQMYGLQSNVRFNLNNISQVLTNNQSQVIFYEWNFETGLNYFCPEINDEVNYYLKLIFKKKNII